MKYLILTGVSKGVGEGIVRSFGALKNVKILGISRSSNEILKKEFSDKLNFFNYDLKDIENISCLMDKIFSNINLNDNDEIYLINNAGVIYPSMPACKLNANEVATHLNINLISPMMICKEFINRTASFSGVKRILNISSGAAVGPVFGWSTYAASKSGLDMFSKVLHLEENEKNSGVEVMVLYPGIIDTNLQEEIRSLDKDNFSSIEKFKSFKEEGQLLSKELVGETICNLIQGEGFKPGEVVRITEYLETK
ncbi:(S)-benzoin forming benzil reductase [Clostridium hydrogeniformans]|uniref:(S)-benzoin forming benzil reductase n=1 Tax=Clostridium hydrogeniformans TaxID=349933 RepID=UPI00047F3974|nr:(S)-benzoin forming benzil reductase [Clostridium hydrogeniformans]